MQQAGVFVRHSKELIERVKELPAERSLPYPLDIKVTEKDLEAAMATAKEQYGIAPGSYVPGSSSSLQPEWSPENQAAEVAEVKGPKGSWQPKLPVAQAAQIQTEKSSGSGGSKGSWKPKSRSNSKVKSEHVEEVPSESTQDVFLDDAIKKWQQELQQKPQSPSSPESVHHPPDDTAEDSPRSIGSGSFTPDWDERHATGEPEYDERHDVAEPEYDSRHDPQEMFAREVKPLFPAQYLLHS